MDAEFIRQRITELRLKKDVSENKMSLDLGHSGTYIRGITSGRVLPSMQEFLYICEYLGVEPGAFFDEQKEERPLVREALQELRQLSDEHLQLLIPLIKQLKK